MQKRYLIFSVLIGSVMVMTLFSLLILSKDSPSFSSQFPDEVSKTHLDDKAWETPKSKNPNSDDIPFIRNISTASTVENQSLVVPNIVHYCWYTDEPRDMRFIDYLGFMSAYKVLRPDAVYFHLNQEPLGPFWKAIKILDRVKVNQTKWPDTILGQKLKEPYFYTDGSDICRTTQILHHGGIYLDMDVLVLKSFDPLRRYDCTLGMETKNKLCGGIIIGAKSTPFMMLWAQSYLDDYQTGNWAYNTGLKPLQLSRNFPGLLHIENDTLHRPNYHGNEINKIWGTDTWDWKHNIALHTWFNIGLKFYRHKFDEPDFKFDSLQDLISMRNCTLKRIVNYIIDLY